MVRLRFYALEEITSSGPVMLTTLCAQKTGVSERETRGHLSALSRLLLNGLNGD